MPLFKVLLKQIQHLFHCVLGGKLLEQVMWLWDGQNCEHLKVQVCGNLAVGQEQLLWGNLGNYFN